MCYTYNWALTVLSFILELNSQIYYGKKQIVLNVCSVTCVTGSFKYIIEIYIFQVCVLKGLPTHLKGHYTILKS